MAVSAKCVRLGEQWRASAEAEMDAAKALRATGQNWGQIYWHCGFAIEQMLKAIRIRREGLEEWPAGDRGAKWHDLEFLADTIIRDELRARCRASITFEANWLTVRDWSHEKRILAPQARSPQGRTGSAAGGDPPEQRRNEMAAGALSEHLIEAGAQLLAALDDAGLQPQGAAWVLDHALGDWRYLLATSLVDTMGRSNVYRELLTVVDRLRMPVGLTVQDVHLAAPGGPLFKTIAGALHIENGRVTVRNIAVEGARVDAVIYRWTGAPSPTRAATIQRHFKLRLRELSDSFSERRRQS